MALSMMSRASRAVAPAAIRPQPRLTVLPARAPLVVNNRRAVVVAKADGDDFDAVLAKWAEDFEKSPNKPVVIAYVVAAISLFFFTEWLIHLSVLDVLLGVPVQALGILSLPILISRYGFNGKDFNKEVGESFSDITKNLPGLEKRDALNK